MYDGPETYKRLMLGMGMPNSAPYVSFCEFLASQARNGASKVAARKARARLRRLSFGPVTAHGTRLSLGAAWARAGARLRRLRLEGS